MRVSTARPERISTASHLRSLRSSGRGYVINEHHMRADGTRKKPTLHGVLCTTLDGVGPEFKLYCADSTLAQTWLNLTKGLEGRSWARCRTCGGVNPGEPVRSVAKVLIPGAQPGRRSPEASGGPTKRSPQPPDGKARHRREATTNGSTPRQLWCQVGAHHWVRPAIQGRRPASCPDHTPIRDVGHPSADRSCFQLECGWSVRLEVSARLRRTSEIDLPEALAAIIRLGPQQLIEVTASGGTDPALRLWRGRREAWCRGDMGRLVPQEAKAGDRLFLAFDLPHYRAELFRVSGVTDPNERLAGLVGLPPAAAANEDFWYRVGRHLGVSASEPRGIADVARARGDTELEEAVSAATRVIRKTGGWGGNWDLSAPLHPDSRYMAVSDGHRCRVAVGVADPRDRLPEKYLVTPGGLVWADVDEPDRARRETIGLSPDVLAPAQSEAWVTWMRLEHTVRRASLAGVEWRLLVDRPNGWRTADGRTARRLATALGTVAHSEGTGVPDAKHVRHTVARSALVIERAVRIACGSTLQVIESDRSAGFASRWAAGQIRSSSVLGVLRPD